MGVVKAAGSLAQLFGSEIKPLDVVVDEITQSSATVEKLGIMNRLAPSFGKEENLPDTMKKLDDKLKVLIAVSNKELLELSAEELTWEMVQSTFMKNQVAQPKEEAVTVPESFDWNNDTLKWDGSPDPKVVADVLQWWNKAVPVEDIRRSTNIDIDAIANIVAGTGNTVRSFGQIFEDDHREEKRLLDIGALRYPDLSNPYFTIFRIEVFAWAHYHRTLWNESDENGIRSVLTYQRFQPREDVIKDLKDETRKKAAHEVDDMFPDN